MSSYSERYLLSSSGSDRATAYGFSNKMISLGNRTHVVWTDAVAFTRGRTFDHSTGAWGETLALGEGCDNHNNPCLTADREGRLHLAYGPHDRWDNVHQVALWPAGMFKHAIAAEPNSLRGLERCNPPFGYSATYAGLAHTAEGCDAIVYRGGEPPRPLLFQKQNGPEAWTQAQALFRQDIAPQYTFYGGRLAATADGLLYVGAHLYAEARGHSLGVMAIRSADFGRTWTDLTGQPATVPVAYEARFAAPHPPAEFDPRLGGLGVAPDGRLWVLTHAAKAGCYQSQLSCWQGRRWETIEIARFLPEPWGCVDGPLTIDTCGRIHLFVSAVDRRVPPPGQELFGHAGLAVFHLCSPDQGASFTCQRISPPDPEVPNWLPSVSLTGAYHPVARVALLYTRGRPQTNAEVGCRHTVETEVYCVFVLD